MTTYTIIASTVAQGSQEAELDTHVDDFNNQDEVIGYARRMAEEMFALTEQLNLDLDYSNVSIFDGDQGDVDVDADAESFVGMWFFDEEGTGYASAEALRHAAEEGEAEEEDVKPN
jgi:hypothetical protein